MWTPSFNVDSWKISTETQVETGIATLHHLREGPTHPLHPLLPLLSPFSSPTASTATSTFFDFFHFDLSGHFLGLIRRQSVARHL